MRFLFLVLVPVRASPVPSVKKKENRQPKGGPKERKKTDNPREGWEDGTPPPHRDFKDRSVVLAVAHPKTLGRLPLSISLRGEPVCVPVRASPRPCRASVL